MRLVQCDKCSVIIANGAPCVSYNARKSVSGGSLTYEDYSDGELCMKCAKEMFK